MIHPLFRRFCAAALLSLCMATAARAQWASVRGHVADAADGQPLAGASVVLTGEAGERLGTATDADGFFALTGIRPGRYVLSASFLGYAPFSDTLAFTFAEERTLDIALTPDEREMEEIVVETERRPDRRMAGLTAVAPSALARTPMPDVTYDLAGYLLTLPGFVAPGDRGGQLFVRGGTPTQNLVLLDGMPVYQPFHIVGFFSAFPADLLAYADVYAGGFGARYGGRISSVIDVTTRNGDKRRVTGAASIAPFLSSLRVEIPVVRNKVSVLASVRESVIERLSDRLLGRELPFRFGDRFVKLHAFLSPTSSFSATALRTFDEGNVAATEGDADRRFSTWRNEAYGGRYTFLPPEAAVMTQVAVYVSRLESRYRLTDDDERRAEVGGFNAELTFHYLFDDARLDFGIFGGSTRFTFERNGTPRTGNANVTSGGGFFEARLDLGRQLQLTPGLRLHSFSNGVRTALDPRFRARWLPHGPASKTEFTAAWGLYHQQIIGLNNEQDVTDVFTVWAAAPERRPLPRAMHLIAGIRRRLSPWIELSAEGYLKRLANISFPRFSNALSDDVERFLRVKGEARGLDLRLEMNRPAFFARLDYSLGAVTYEPSAPDADFGDRFSPPHDRRHQLNVLVALARGPYRLSLAWQFGSGLPFTRINGYYDRLSLTDPNDDAFHTASGETFVSRGPAYRGRLPAYHRLDVSARRVFTFERVVVTLQAGVVNVYDRANIFQYNFFTGERVNQLPLIPSAGLKVEVR